MNPGHARWTSIRRKILGKIDGAFEKAFGTRVKWAPFNYGADVLTLFAAMEIDIAHFRSSPAAAVIPRKLPIEVIGTPEIIATRDLQKDGVLIFNNFAVRKEFEQLLERLDALK